MINTTGNMTYFLNYTGTYIQRKCTGTEFKTLECWITQYCPAINSQVINSGMILILSVIVITIIMNIFLKKLYKPLLKIENITEYIDTYEKRLKIKLIVTDTLNSVLLLYVMLIVYLNI